MATRGRCPALLAGRDPDTLAAPARIA